MNWYPFDSIQAKLFNVGAFNPTVALGTEPWTKSIVPQDLGTNADAKKQDILKIYEYKYISSSR